MVDFPEAFNLKRLWHDDGGDCVNMHLHDVAPDQAVLSSSLIECLLNQLLVLRLGTWWNWAGNGRKHCFIKCCSKPTSGPCCSLRFGHWQRLHVLVVFVVPAPDLQGSPYRVKHVQSTAAKLLIPQRQNLPRHTATQPAFFPFAFLASEP